MEAALKRARIRWVLCCAAALAGGCANPSDDSVADVPGDDDAGADDGADADEGTDDAAIDDAPTDRPWVPPTDSLVYVHTRTTLYFIDPAVSLELQTVGEFSGACTSGSDLYDIALDGDGNIVGIAAEGLYSIDRTTAACGGIRAFPDGSPHFFSLSYVKGSDPADPLAEPLFAASVEEGEWVEINPAGTTVDTIFGHVGTYDPPDFQWVSSGDIVSIEVGPGAYRTFATLKCSSGYTDPGCESDMLAEIDPVTGRATMIGLTGFQQVFGLGFWGDLVYGFTNDGEFIRINVTSGAGTLVRSYPDLSFWGAGTTTKPYVLL
jgi:hypothetical protein